MTVEVMRSIVVREGSDVGNMVAMVKGCCKVIENAHESNGSRFEY